MVKTEGTSASWHDSVDPQEALIFEDMPENEEAVVPADFPGRLALALKQSGKTQSRAGRELGLSQGYMGRLLSGERGSKALSPELIRQLADYLGVQYEWLAIGRGPQRATGWAPSALEEAMIFATRHGARRDAIDAAIESHREAENMTGTDWVLAISNEAKRLEHLKVPRPEVIEKKQKQTRRFQAKKRRASLDDQPPVSAAKKKRAR